MSETTSTSRAERAANLFDLRRIIGGVFTAWGILLTLLGLFGSDAENNKAAGLNINLIAGLGMLIVGVIFLVWAFTRPLGTELREAEEDERPGAPGHAAPRGVDAAAFGSQQPRRGTRRDRQRPGEGGDPGSE